MSTKNKPFDGPVQPVHIMAAGIRTKGLDEMRDHRYVEEYPGVLHEALAMLSEQLAAEQEYNEDH